MGVLMQFPNSPLPSPESLSSLTLLVALLNSGRLLSNEDLTAPALALLLVFRTEASYSSFEKGRKAWTKVIAGTSEFARQAGTSDTNITIKNALMRFCKRSATSA
ncbi:UPF0187 protein At2g45870, chloroplastic-like [Papaver somniferum]|uniref:UPF0187 protein At2g45870, chloroplastic-like n=1 Tax=Papaver somniferum TaxID=3469 RepID=UPI000E6F6E88|nr:UPF0187 protein At2g45870, chloroplastic-like [Papaver somniferum]